MYSGSMPTSLDGSADVRQLSPDVLVIGAGPAGSATAALLARQGVDVVAIDRAAFPRDKPCAEYLSPETVRLLDGLGIVAQLEHDGARPLAGTVVRGPRGAHLHGLFARARPAPLRPTGLSVTRWVLDQHLAQAARSAGAWLLERTTLESLLLENGSVAGALVHGPEGRLIVRARLTIGADGLRSTVARRLGLRSQGRLRRVALVAHFSDVADLGESAEMHVSAEGYVGLNRVDANLVNVALVLPASQARGARGRLTHFFFARLERFPGVRGRVDRGALAGPVLATGPFAARSRRAAVDGAALVGDAAEFFDPFTGEGICSALRGAEMLADHALAALAKPGIVSAGRLRGYRHARWRAFAGKWAVERLIGYGMIWPTLFDRAVGRLGRRAGMAHTLIGVTGNFVPTRRVLNPWFLARMVL
jgi:flavin-dependent dehydrogenase